MRSLSLTLSMLCAPLFFLGCNSNDGKLDRAKLPAPTLELVNLTTAYPEVIEVFEASDTPTIGGRSIVGSCTGTFVSEMAVLTAAHCLKKTQTHIIRTGRSNLLRVKQSVSLGVGNADDQNDIAILVVEPPTVAGSRPFLSLGNSVSLGDTVRLVGFCEGKKTGTNMVFSLGSFIEVLTPSTSNYRVALVGPSNRAGSCFGDSGGPMLKDVGGKLQVVGVDHAAGSANGELSTDYIDITRPDNRNFLRRTNETYDLKIQGL